MIKFIMSSGGIKTSSKIKNFFGEIFKIENKKPKVLLCFFAEKREDWENKFGLFSEIILSNIDSSIKPEFTLASQENFVQEIEQSDIIYFYGGDIELLKFRLEEYRLEELLQDKIVAGSSSGFVIFVKTFFDSDYRRIDSGLGIIPIKTIPHFEEEITDSTRGSVDWNLAEEKLQEAEPQNLEITEIKTGDYRVFEINSK